MAVVALIPTGMLEHAALAPALARLFPDHTFVVRPKDRHLDGFTSRDVAPLASAQPGPIPTNLDELAAELVNAIFPGRPGQRIDFAYVMEDLELFWPFRRSRHEQDTEERQAAECFQASRPDSAVRG
jgi:hypothetical protein